MPGAECCSYGHFVLFRGGTSQHQIGHVHRRDEEHQPHRTQQHQEGGADLAHYLVSHRHDVDSPPGEELRVHVAESGDHTVHVTLSIFERHVRLHARDNTHRVRAAVLKVRLAERDRKPQIEIVVEIVESVRQHTHDGHRG